MKVKYSNDEVIRSMVFITTEGGDEGGDTNTDNCGDGGDNGGDAGGDDLSTLFTPEEIEGKKTSIAEARAEEERRASLTDEERTAEDEAAAATAKQNEVPETYEFTVPEGMTIETEIMSELQTFASENKLTSAEAQKIADMGVKLVNKQLEMRETQFGEIKKGWLESAKADKEIGADVNKGKESLAARAFNTIATPEMKDLVDHYGIGDHPEMLRMFYRLSSLMGDDGMQIPGTGAGLGSGNALSETVGSIFNHPSRKAGSQ